MIAADTLARELGCTLSDLKDLRPLLMVKVKADTLLRPNLADYLRAEWSKKTGVDYTETVQ